MNIAEQKSISQLLLSNLQSLSPKLLPQFRQLAKQKQQQIQDKINQTLHKQKHINKLSDQLQQRLRIKNNEILRKLNKSVQIKQKSMQKIKQKCHIRNVYEDDKKKQYKKKQRMSLNKQWKQSNRLADWVNNRQGSNKEIQRKQTSTKQQYKQQLLDQIVPLQQSMGSPIKSRVSHIKNIREQPRNRTLTLPMPRNPQFIKDEKYENIKLNNSKKQLYTNNLYSNYRIVTSSRSNINQQNIQKINQFKQMKQKQQLKKFNEKMEKLQEARMKKHKLQMEKQKKLHHLMQYKKQKLQQALKNIKVLNSQHKRAKTQGNASQFQNAGIYTLSQKNQMFKQWEYENKIRNLRLFQMRLKKGEDYMNSMKDKTLKTKIERNIQMNSIQKKLYLERIKVHQLSINKN